VTPRPLVDAPRSLRQVLATGVLGALTAYLLLDRSHAEEIGGGARVAAEFLRGERPLSTPTWLALAAAGLVTVVARRGRPRARCGC